VEYQRIGAGLVPAGLSTGLCPLPFFVGVVGVGCGKGWLVAGSVVYGTLLGPEATGAGLFLGRGRITFCVVGFLVWVGCGCWGFWFSWACLPVLPCGVWVGC
jgi:hypothetical protein